MKPGPGGQRRGGQRDGSGDRTPRFRDALRMLFRSRNGSDDLRDTIEELIEQEDSPQAEYAEELVLLRNVLSIRDVTVDDVMVPRADIVAVAMDSPLDEVGALMSDCGHSRLPVYRDRLDDVIGMIHIKDLLAGRNGDRPGDVTAIIRELLFVAPSMPVLELLLQMRVKRVHMALVVDEFGGIDGLVTIEDLVEEIVGEIEDEHDDENRPRLIRRGSDMIDVDARVEIADFEEEAGAFLTDDERTEDFHTVGGLVFYLAGHVPRRGEIVRHQSGIEFEILDADPRRIRRMRATGVPNAAAADGC